MTKELNLMLHCGAQLATLDDVKNSPTPEPTRSWVPVSHHDLFHRVKSTLEFNGFEVINQAHALGRNQQRYFSMLQVEPTRGERSNQFGTVVGLRNSHDKCFSAGLVLGNAPFVCDNLAFSGEVKIARKHTKNIHDDLEGLIEGSIDKLFDLKQKTTNRISNYQLASIDDRDAHHLIIQAMRNDAIPNSKIPQVIEEWETPRHQEFEERTVWSLYNCFTEVQKSTSLFRKPQQQSALHSIFDAFAMN